MDSVELGDGVRDRMTAAEGVVDCIARYLYGPTRILVQPNVKKDGAPVNGFWIEEPRLEVVKKHAV